MPHMRPKLNLDRYQYQLKDYVGRPKNRLTLDGEQRWVTIDLKVAIDLSYDQSARLKKWLSIQRMAKKQHFLI